MESIFNNELNMNNSISICYPEIKTEILNELKKEKNYSLYELHINNIINSTSINELENSLKNMNLLIQKFVHKFDVANDNGNTDPNLLMYDIIPLLQFNIIPILNNILVYIENNKINNNNIILLCCLIIKVVWIKQVENENIYYYIIMDNLNTETNELFTEIVEEHQNYNANMVKYLKKLKNTIKIDFNNINNETYINVAILNCVENILLNEQLQDIMFYR